MSRGRRKWRVKSGGWKVKRLCHRITAYDLKMCAISVKSCSVADCKVTRSDSASSFFTNHSPLTTPVLRSGYHLRLRRLMDYPNYKPCASRISSINPR